ncbi:MAG TPA: tetratricopeptide repeat protein, partial [Fimbriiglobus sp.]|nr:tetratricopeptide repeat protein [Fimbriiglobus sp.]
MAHPAKAPGGLVRPVRLRRPILIWVAIGLAAAGAVVGLRALEQRRSRDEGIRLALSGELAAAEPLLATALEQDPDDADAWRALALGRLTAGKLDDADGPADRWRALRPRDPEPHLTRIDLAVKRRRLDDAIDSAATVLELQPSAGELRERRAGWLFLVGRTEEAATECRRCRETRPDDPALTRLEAEICVRLGDNARAEVLVGELLRRHPRDATALTLRGALELEADRPDRAVPPLREAIAHIGPTAARARHFLGLALARTGNESEARKLQAEGQVQQAVELWEKYGRPDTVGYKVTIAEALLATGRTEEAVRLLELAVAQTPDCAAAHRLLADHYTA